jgi:phosphoribosylanthranilate isomerase
MRRTRIKICGITRVEDALCAAKAGADAIGMIFYAASPRALTIERAVSISAALPPFLSIVALFVNAKMDEVDEVIRRLRPSLLQFHGDESAGDCAGFGIPFLKAIRVASGTTADDLLECEQQFGAARGLLLDTSPSGASGTYGGSGEPFDWTVIPEQMRQRIVLAGGLNTGNVSGAVRLIRPWAVDVSSGVEASGQPKGIKDSTRIVKFIEEVRHADAG